MAITDKNTIYSWFQTDDFPTEAQFRATWDSFWHKSESIPMSQITGLNQLFQQTATVAQLNNKANIDGSNIDVSAYQEKLNITNLIATAKEEVKNELLNGAPEAFDTLKEISDWISDDETAEAAILQAIQNEATARTEADNQKLDKGNYTGTAQDLYNRFEGKIVAGYNSIPKVGNGASGKVLTDSVVSEIYGKVGIDLLGEASEKLEVNGNVKANSYKFNLQSSLTPTPNTLVPKADGSYLEWFDNNSVKNKIPTIPTSWSFRSGYFSGDDTAILIGKNAGNSNVGYNCIGIGKNSMYYAAATIYDSVGIGSSTLMYAGQYSVAVGNDALSNSSTALYCVAIGNNALWNGGESNTAIGFWAGIRSKSNNKYCVFVGAKADVDAGIDPNNITNMIVIGYNAVGKGSNTVELGNNDIENTYLKGKVILNNRLKLASYTKAQRDALTNKTIGEIIWQTDRVNSGIRVFDGTNWLAVQTVID